MASGKSGRPANSNSSFAHGPWYDCHMTSMTVRDMQLHWPTAEKALAEGEEILLTRDSKPVARLMPLAPGSGQKRQRFDPVAHARRMQRFWKNTPSQPSTDVLLILVWTREAFDSRMHLCASLPATISREGQLLHAA